MALFDFLKKGKKKTYSLPNSVPALNPKLDQEEDGFFRYLLDAYLETSSGVNEKLYDALQKAKKHYEAGHLDAADTNTVFIILEDYAANGSPLDRPMTQRVLNRFTEELGAIRVSL